VQHIYQVPPIFVGDSLDFQYDIPVRNESDSLVRFTRIRQSCSCSAATKLAAMELEPGQETTLHFHADLRGRLGPQRYICYLVEAGGVEWTYGVETSLHERARFVPHGSIHFGMVNPRADESRELEFRLHAENERALPAKVTFRTEGEHLKVQALQDTIEEQPDGTCVRSYRLQVGLYAPQTPGLGHHLVYAEFERQGVKQKVESGVSWNVRSFYEVQPAQAYFGTVDTATSESIERQLIIRRTDGEPLTIKSVKSPSDALQWSLEKTKDDSMAKLVLVLDPKAMAGAPLWGEMMIETNVAMQPLVKVSVAALTK
jgi:hypothetical protein